LSSTYVRKIVQDPYGFIWIATQDGLNRYDGRNFAVYNKGIAGRYTLTGADIWDILLDTTDHLIWAVSSYGGIDAIDYNTGNRVFDYDQTPDKATQHLRFTSLALKGNRLWLGSSEGAFFLDLRDRQLYRPALPGGSGLVDRIFIDAAGRLWLFYRDAGLALIETNSDSSIRFLSQQQLGCPPKTGIRFYSCIQNKDGRLLLATNRGLRAVWAGGTGAIGVDNNPYPEIPLSQGRDIYSCKHDSSGATWFCAAGSLIKISKGNSFATIRENSSADEFRWIDAVYDIFFDKNNDCWLGCQQGLLFAENRPAGFVTVHKSSASEASIRHAYYIDARSDTLLYCCAQDGLFRVNPKTGLIIPINTAKPFYHAWTDVFHRIIVGNSDGSYVLTDGKFLPLASVYPEFGPLKKIEINSHCCLGDSLVIFGTENDRGVVAWNYKRRKATVIDTASPGLFLQENTINTVYKDLDGRVWVLGDHSGSILDFGTGKTHSLNTYDPVRNQSYSIFFDVVRIGRRYYLATYGSGVLVLDSQYHFIQQLDINAGLTSNSTYKLLPFRDSLLFVTSNNGLSAIDLRHNDTIRQYYESDGLHSDIFEENSGAVCNGLLYAGGVDGLTVIDPLLLHAAQAAPLLRPNAITIQTASETIDTANILLTSMDISNNALQTTVSFSSFNYSNPDRVSYSYRIKELKGRWISLGKRDFINFIGQNPGNYTLQVRAADGDGRVNGKILELSLNFLPKWYQTWWFKFAIVLALAGIFYGLYRYRLLQIHKQQQIRRDIASDLHDDIGGTLNSVKIFTHLLRRDGNNAPHLLRIEESIAEASAGLRDFIWVLDDSQDTIRELLERIKKFAGPVCQANDIRLESSYEETVSDWILSKTTKRNLLLIAKETITNAIKYSQCRCISLYIGRDSSRLVFSIRDDGNGFDLSAATMGHGIKNIRQRAIQIRYSAEIISAPGKGTEIWLREK